MVILSYLVLLVYSLALTYITVYCLIQLHLLYYYKKHHWRKGEEDLLVADPNSDLPFVTIQLPIYNELYVVERLVENITEFDYPKDKFEIHVLDDSTDETVEVSRKCVERFKALGFNIEHITRTIRTGFKAGALKEAMQYANGDLIAIFDADFLPRPDFLLRTVKHFENDKIGVVQTKWEHINKDYSLLTRMQAMQLDVHFTVEQQGREAGNCLLQFNGTAGVWRRQTIDDAGGWEADTLTEDLDLSYRAQLKGWQIVYLEEVGSPAELPAEMNGLKSQQFRWTKGGAETARKMLPTIWKSDISLKRKLHGTVHLMSSGIFIFIFLTAILSVPLMFLMKNITIDLSYSYLFMSAVLAVILVYYVANVEALHNNESYLKRLFKFVFLFPFFLSLSMGLSLHNTIAVIQGYLGKQSAFIRTPKFGIKNIRDTFQKGQYLARRISIVTIFEGILACYFLFAFVAGFFMDSQAFMLYHGMLAFGFGGICFYSIKHLSLKQ